MDCFVASLLAMTALAPFSSVSSPELPPSLKLRRVLEFAGALKL
jgi:hypothetical protein